MIVFVDTSAFAKAFLTDEASSAEVVEILTEAELVLASELAYVETCSAIARAERTRPISTSGVQDRRLALERRWPFVTRTQLGGEELEAAGELCFSRGLKALDAIQLGSALAVRELIDAFVSADSELLAAAQDEGFATAAV